MAEYTKKPTQFRLPAWAVDFIAQETSERHVTKTDVVVEALDCLKRRRFEQLMAEGYRETAEQTLEEVREWDGTLADSLEDEEW